MLLEIAAENHPSHVLRFMALHSPTLFSIAQSWRGKYFVLNILHTHTSLAPIISLVRSYPLCPDPTLGPIARFVLFFVLFLSGGGGGVQVNCILNPSEVELILIPCSSEFDDLTFVLGQKKFALTVSLRGR